MSHGFYLFCLARLSRLPPLPLIGWRLDDRHPLQVVGFQDLAAVCCPVSMAQARLRDLTSSGPWIIRHQEVVSGVMRHSAVLPARPGTLFRSLANLGKMLQHHYDTIVRFLERTAQQEEWSVKGLLDRSEAQERLLPGQSAREGGRLKGLLPGLHYSQEPDLRADGARELSRWLAEVCWQLWADLRGYAAEVRARRLFSRKDGGSDQEMVLNWAFLIPAPAAPGFLARIREDAAYWLEYGLTLECTGPWPPYSFAPPLWEVSSEQ